jgi:tetratricopeptide (TPR) repeat protein
MPDSRRRRAGVHVRPGAVRQARLEAGLSLAQVSAGHLTRNAIHLVESGRSRPSMETLQLIADRTGRPVDFFLAEAPNEATEDWADRHHGLVEVESALARGELDSALEQARALLAAGATGTVAATLRLRLAEAYCRRHQPEEAMVELAAARPALEAAGDDWLVLEVMDWEAAALSLQDDPRAVGLLEEARARASAMLPVPRAILTRVESHLAMLHVQRHAFSKAIKVYESAIAHSSDLVDLLELARIHQGLAHAYQRVGQPGKALTHASRALGLFELRSEARMQAASHINLGDLLLQQGKLEEAEDHLRRGLEQCERHGIHDRGRGYALWALGELQLRRGSLADAMDLGLETVAAGQAQREPVVAAGGMQVVGAALAGMGMAAEADREFEQALTILESLDQPLRLRDAHMAYAAVLEARDDVTAAMRHWRTAAELGRDAQPVAQSVDAIPFRATAG